MKLAHLWGQPTIASEGDRDLNDFARFAAGYTDPVP